MIRQQIYIKKRGGQYYVYKRKIPQFDITKIMNTNSLIDIRPNTLKILLELLSPNRFDNYNSWLEIGITLSNIGKGDESYLELWEEFSKKSKSWEEGICRKKWNIFNNRNDKNGLGLGSMFYWARLDNPIRYMRLRCRCV